MMALVLARLIVQAVAAMVMVAGGLILVGIGHVGDALTLGIISYVIMVIAAPHPDDRAAFERFQKDRIAGPPP